MSISAVILTHNEENNISDCLKSLSWCDEQIVVDDDSTDKTIEIAKKHVATVYMRGLGDDFAMQRNFGLEKAKYDWILFVDADERVTTTLKGEILKQIENDKVNGYYIKREDTMWGKVFKHGEQGEVQLLRLGRKGKGKWTGKVHETWSIEGPKDSLENPLSHFPHPTLKEFLIKINFYSTLRANELHNQGVRANWLSIIAHPKVKFFQDYFVKLGFLDGIEGFIVAMLMSMHAFLVRGKLWQLDKKS